MRAMNMPLRGRGVQAGATPPLNEWQQVSIAAHSRKVIRGNSPASSSTYSTTVTGAQATTEGLTPETVSAIPARGYNVWVQDTSGNAYYMGSLHSGYRGNEIDKIALPTGLSTVATTTISHQPNSPPSGPNSGYDAGTGQYIYKQSYAPEGVTGLTDQTAAANWQPFAPHTWTMNTWTPTTGPAYIVAHAVQDSYPSGAYVITGGVLQSSGAQPTDAVGAGTGKYGLVGFNYGTGKYTTYISQLGAEITSLPDSGSPFTDSAAGLGASGITDWNADLGEILLFNRISSEMSILKWKPATGLTVVARRGASGATAPITVMGGPDGHSSNGILIRHLEGSKYLYVDQRLTGYAGISIGLFSEAFGSGDARVQSPGTMPGNGAGQPFEDVDGDPLSFCVDKAGRRVFWIVAHISTPPKIYVSSFDSLMTWTEVVTTGLATWSTHHGTWMTLNRQPMLYWAGYLYLHDPFGDPNAPVPDYHSNTMGIKRCYVGT